MNRIEALVDRLDPRVSVHLRRLKKALVRDPVLRIVEALARPGDVAVDIGANRGVYTLALSRSVGARGRVHCFDPVPVNVRSLERLERAHSNITVHPIALSDRAGDAELHLPVRRGKLVDALARLGAPPAGEHVTRRVPTGTLDEILGDGAVRLSIVKCDVEGHEHQVLRGGQAVLSRDLPALVVEIEQRHRADDMMATIDELLSWGYRGYGVGAATLTPVADFDLERDQLRYLSDDRPAGGQPDAGYVGNFLFVRPDVDLGGLVAS